MNCFWGPQDFFSNLSGVVNTTVGYSGGTKENPTYTDLGNHTETLEIEFSPEETSFETLLQHFFKEHNPTFEKKTQYKSAIFYHDEQQQKLAEEYRQKYEEETGDAPLTEIVPASTFYPAEEYHQHYLKKARGDYEA